MTSAISSANVDQVLRALADPTRRALLERVGSTEATIARLTEQARISQPAVSQHIAVLRAAGLLRQRQQGRSTFYRADPAGLTPLVDWIALQERFWRTSLDRLETLMKETDT